MIFAHFAIPGNKVYMIKLETGPIFLCRLVMGMPSGKILFEIASSLNTNSTHYYYYSQIIFIDLIESF